LPRSGAEKKNITEFDCMYGKSEAAITNNKDCSRESPHDVSARI